MSPFMQPVLEPHAHAHQATKKQPRTLVPDAEGDDHKRSAPQSAPQGDGERVSFSNLGLAAPVQAALVEENYHTPTPIQAQAIPTILKGRDILGCAQTGTGKTAAFALPVLSRLLTQPTDKSRVGPARPRVIVLSPTRELATQIGDSFATYGRHTGLKHTVIFGGVSQFHQVRALHRGVDILVATPGRLLDLMEQRLTDFRDVHTFILDEADRMLDMGFIQPIRRIAAAVPTERQTLLFSATMPKEIMHLADSLLRDPVKVSVTPVASAAPLIEQSLYMVHQKSKPALLKLLLEDESMSRVVVFIRTKHGANKLATALERFGVDAVAIHGNKSQNQRERALDLFRAGRSRVLVATDVAARGLDVDGVTHVINYDLPMEPEAYVHRIGRTGRAGATGIAIAFCDREEQALLQQIEKMMRKRIPLKPTPSLPESAVEIRQPVPRDQVRRMGGRDENTRLYDDRRQPQRGPRNERVENTADPIVPHRERRTPDVHRDAKPAHASGHHGDDHGSAFVAKRPEPYRQEPKPRAGTPRHEMAKRAAQDARTEPKSEPRAQPRGDSRGESRPYPRTDARPDARPEQRGDRKIGGKFAHKYGNQRPAARPNQDGGQPARSDAPRGNDRPAKAFKPFKSSGTGASRGGFNGPRSDRGPRSGGGGGGGRPSRPSGNRNDGRRR
ncbi:MAG TPA: DEAD/DEAH box helicase [Phycisphaerales bacterium]|nr:DEAD/DEAH box helicase [Phycisphaerales bacterium]